MPTVHEVVAGETLARIAKQYKFTTVKAIYEHEDNQEFRTLRPNPNVIYAGDKINIPEKELQIFKRHTGQSYTFQVGGAPKDKFKMKVENSEGVNWEGKRVVLSVGGEDVDAMVDGNGMIEVDLPETEALTGDLKLYMDDELSEPTHTLTVGVGELDPIDTLSGVQARCNALGYQCGVADGKMGTNTKNGVKSFQSAYGLDVDGVPGPMTKGKLQEAYGC